MICRSGKLRRHRVEQHRVRQAQPEPVAAAHAGADAGLPGVEERRDPGILNRRVQRIVRLVARVEPLHGRVELEAAHAMLLDERPRIVHRGRAAERIDRAERDQHVVVARGTLGDLGGGERSVCEPGAGVDGEDDRGHAALAVVRGDAVEVGPRCVGAEVPARRLDEVGRQRRMAVAVDLDVHVRVDGLDRVEVDRGLIACHRRFLSRSSPVPEPVEGSGRRRRRAGGRSGSGGKLSPTVCSEPPNSAGNASVSAS